MEPTSTNWAVTAQALLRDLQSQSYEVRVGVSGGMWICASSGADSITYSHNLGGFNRPTQAAAVALLQQMSAVHRELVAASEEFRVFVAAKRFCAELVVFSGQMDFRVAALGEDGAITWYEKLEA